MGGHGSTTTVVLLKEGVLGMRFGMRDRFGRVMLFRKSHDGGFARHSLLSLVGAFQRQPADGRPPFMHGNL